MSQTSQMSQKTVLWTQQHNHGENINDSRVHDLRPAINKSLGKQQINNNAAVVAQKSTFQEQETLGYQAF